MNWAEINNTSLRYELLGEGRSTVVLIHEMGGTLESWDLIAPKLSQRHSVLRYDMRGFGMSEKIRGDLSIETLTEDLDLLLKTVQVSEPVVLVGCAVGAAVAMCFASRYKEQTAGLIALSPSVGIEKSERQARLSRMDYIKQSGMRGLVDQSMASGYPAVFQTQNPSRFAAFRARWLGNDPASFVETFRMLVNLELGEHLRNISCPTVVVGCNHDAVRPPERSEAVARQIKDARFMTLDTGHFSPVLTPDLICNVVEDFLSQMK